MVGVGVAVIALLLLAACGGGVGGSTVSPRTGARQTGARQRVTLQTSTGKPGTYLTDGDGQTLYMFAADPRGGSSRCSGGCAADWPPVITKRPPRAAGEAKKALLGILTRADGSTQVTYNGWPLYYFAGDGAPGDRKGQGIRVDGGLWWVLDPAGHPIGDGSSLTRSGTG